jgi:GT2 family glycosyltransferase
LIECGGFDEDLRSGNDVDVCYKLGLHGYQLTIVQDAVVYHDNRESVQEHFRRFFHYSIYQVLIHKKYKRISGRRWIFNSYPIRVLSSVLLRIPCCVASLCTGRAGPILTAVFEIVEAFGVLAGDLAGSIVHREIYI